MMTTTSCPTCRQTLSSDALFCSNCGLSTAPIFTETEPMEGRPTRFNKKLDPLLGQILDSKYEIIERLGDGGMGAVYRARRLHIGDEVAVKVLHQEYVADARAIERFRREARSAAVISHANVVTIHDFGESKEEGAAAYLVMELVRGASLRALLKQQGCLNPARAVALLRDICAGVGAAHRHGVVHRDLKPDNVIVVPPALEGDRETAKVVDFGLAKLRDLAVESRLTQTGALMGTPYYMSPEQCRGGEHLDARTDVYSLGAMLYEVLSGRPPFHADNIAGLITKHLFEAPPAFSLDLHIPPRLEAACHRAMAKNPEERQADAIVLGRELQAALAGSGTSPLQDTPVAANPIESPERVGVAKGPEAKRWHWLRWVAAGAFALILGAAGLVGLVIYLKRDKSADRSVSATHTNSVTNPTPAQTARVEKNAENGPANANARETSTIDREAGLVGTWIGTYGPALQPAKLVIKDRGNAFSGVLEQGNVRVAFVGTIDSNIVTFRETQVLSGEGWSPGENRGEILNGGRKIAGTGSDAVGRAFGISYSWSFARQ